MIGGLDDFAERRAVPGWWTGPLPTARLAGVFEGGGLKGIAYAGALEGVAASGAWFGAVAGASAGAITAALVAAGAGPDDLSAATESLAVVFTEHLRTGASLAPSVGSTGRRAIDGYLPCATGRLVFGARARLRDPEVAALASGDALVAWLDDRLAQLLNRNWPGARVTQDRSVTFAGLHSVTGIELVVVAVDALSSRHCIFSHATSPTCSIAEAAVASSSIPFVLRPRRLEWSPREGAAVGFAHPIVDGGVWTNFPMFVFEDARFRAFHGLPPLGDLRVIGFLLTELQTHGARMGPSRIARFVASNELDPHHCPRILPAEALLSFDADELERYAAPGSVVARAERSLRNSAMRELLSDPRRIPGWRATPKRRRSGRSATSSSWSELALRYVGLLSESLLLTLAAWAVAVWGFGIAIARVYSAGVAPRTSWREIVLAAGLYVIAALGLTILGLFIMILVANAFAYNALRKHAAPLVSTYLRGSGAPYWLTERSPYVDTEAAEPPPNIVALPIVEGVTTLAITPGDGETAGAVVDRQREVSRRTATEAVRRWLAMPG